MKKPLTLCQAKNLVAKGEATFCYRLGYDINCRAGGTHETVEAAQARANELTEKYAETYFVVTCIRRQGVEARWQTGQGRAGGEIRVAHKFSYVTEIEA